MEKEIGADGPRSCSATLLATRYGWMAAPSGPWTIRVDRRHAVRRREIEASVSTAWLARLNAAAGPRLRPDTRASSSSHRRNFRCTDTPPRESVPLRNVSLATLYIYIARFPFLSSSSSSSSSLLVDLLFSLLYISIPTFLRRFLFPRKSIFRSNLFKLVSPGQADPSRLIRH